MVASPLPSDHAALLLADPAEASAEDLVRRLLARVDTNNGHSPAAGEAAGQEVVLGVEVDGVSYALVRRTAATQEAHVSLSPREREIARLVANGLPNKAIADVLDVSLWTVGTHLRRIFAKLSVNSRAEMVAHVLGDGLLDRR